MSETIRTTSPAVDEAAQFGVGDEVEVYLNSDEGGTRGTWELAEVTNSTEIKTAAGQRVFVYEVIFNDDTLDDAALLYGAGELRVPLYEDQPCRECGCAPGERFSEMEGDGVWASLRECQCDCHSEDDTSD